MNSQRHISKTASRKNSTRCAFASSGNRRERRAASRVWARRRAKRASGESLYNYFRDYDPATGRYIQSDPIGLGGGINTYGYVGAKPLRRIDFFGLSEADVQGVMRDTLASFPELNPEGQRVCFRTMPSGINGQTSNWSGEVCVDPSWVNPACFTKAQYKDLFSTLFHESMHSNDSWLMRAFGTEEHHETIYRREVYEMDRPNKRIPLPKMYGKPRNIPLDIDRLYEGYKKRTPACQCEK